MASSPSPTQQALLLFGQTNIGSKGEKSRREGDIVPARKRKRRERTHEWHDIQQATL